MLGWSSDPSATVNPARNRDLCQHYAARLHRRTLLTLDDAALAEHVLGAVIVDERAPAPVPWRGEDNGGPRHVRASRLPRIRRRDMAALLCVAVRKLAASSAADARN